MVRVVSIKMLHNQSTTSDRTVLFPKIIGKIRDRKFPVRFLALPAGLMRVFYIMPAFLLLLAFLLLCQHRVFHWVVGIIRGCLRHLRTEKCQEPTGRLAGKKTLPILLFSSSRVANYLQPDPHDAVPRPYAGACAYHNRSSRSTRICG